MPESDARSVGCSLQRLRGELLAVLLPARAHLTLLLLPALFFKVLFLTYCETLHITVYTCRSLELVHVGRIASRFDGTEK